jgi:hypothetical protein
MAKPAKYVHAGIPFKTKDEIKQYIKRYKNSQASGTRVCEPYRSVLLSLLEEHPHRHEFPANISSCEIFIVKSKEERHSHFELEIGKIRKLFAYDKCITGGTPEDAHRKSAIKISREIVEGQIKRFRDNRCCDGIWICEEDGNRCETVHVDHDNRHATFMELLDGWLVATNRTMADIQLVKNPITEWYQFDSDTANSWAAYHEEHAQLRILCAPHNLDREHRAILHKN